MSDSTVELAPERVHFGFDNTFARLPAHFHARVAPAPVRNPSLIAVNARLAERLGLDPASLASDAGVQILSGNRVATGSEPLAQAYAGHQFGHFVPQLGDGRANLLGEVVAPDGARFDLQLKGSGPTPFSRRGDGRAAVGPVLREYVVSEAMAALGVPTTRALAAVTTGEPVFRETVQPGAVLTRVASSHLRVGTFQFFASRGDLDGVRTLARYAIERHYPDAAGAPNPWLALLRGVIQRQATLVAQWMLHGFIHGVLNTDNTSISGETIDYGPCAFLEAYEPDKVYSSIDRQGRYAYNQQPFAMHWNLARLAECLLPLLGEVHANDDAGLADAKDALEEFLPRFQDAYRTGLLRKIGIVQEREGDAALAEELLELMAAQGADFTLTFRRLALAAESTEGDAAVGVLFRDPAGYGQWAQRWRERLGQDPLPAGERRAAMERINPAYIPRNHLVQAMIEAAVTHGDHEPFRRLLRVLEWPFDESAGMEAYTTPARPEECVLQTFCGT